MRTAIVYKRESEYGREVEEYLRDFYHRTGHEIETIDPDSRDGASFCQAYDIVEYPTIIAVSDDGHVQSTWRGRPLPTVSEVSYYA